MKQMAGVVLLIVLGGCAVTTVEHRYKERFDHFYRLLNDTEKIAFRQDKFTELGLLLEKRMKQDEVFSNAMDKIMFDEAIHTFRMDQVGMFFKRYILTGFHQDDYATLVSLLPKEIFLKFIRWENDLEKRVMVLINKDKKLSNWWKKVITDGRLKDFSLGEVLAFYRWYIFPEKTQKEVYYVLKFLSEQQLLRLFMQEDPEFGNYLLKKKTQIVTSRELQAIKERALLTSLSDEEFFQVYRQVIFKEMDKNAFAKTLSLFKLE